MAVDVRKTALITGASRGLGCALCWRYLDEGFDVIGISRRTPNPDLRHQTAFTWLRGDLTKRLTYRRIEQHLVELNGLQVLINCAGLARFGPIHALDFEEVQSMVSLNLAAPMALTGLCSGPLAIAGGTVVNILSTAALRINAEEAVYCATKHGLKAFTKAARKEFSTREIRVMSVYPGGMDTSLWNDPANADRRPVGALDPHAVAAQIFRFVEAPVDPDRLDLVIPRDSGD